MDGRPESNWGSQPTDRTLSGCSIASGENRRLAHAAPAAILLTALLTALLTKSAVAADPESPAPAGKTLGDHFGQAVGENPAAESTAELPTVSTPRLLGYGIAFVALAGAGILLIRSARRSPRDPAGKRLLEVVGRVAVGPKQHLTLVRLRHRVFVLGVTSEQISLLDRLEDPTEVAGIVPPSSFERELQSEAIEEAARELSGSAPSAATSPSRSTREPNDAEDPRLSSFQHEFHRLRGVLQGLGAGPSDVARHDSRDERRERRA